MIELLGGFLSDASMFEGTVPSSLLSMSISPSPNAPLSPNRQNGLSLDTLDQMPGFDPSEVIRIVLHRKYLILSIFVVVVAIGSYFVLRTKKIYDSSAMLVVDTKSNGLGSLAGADPLLASLTGITQAQDVMTQAEIMSSPESIRAVFGRFSDEERKRGFGGALPEWSLSVTPKKDTSVIDVKVTAYDPQLASQFANNIVQYYLDQDLKRNNQAAQQAAVFVKKQMDITQDRLEHASTDLADFERKNGIIELEPQYAAFTSTYEQLKMEAITLERESKGAQKENESAMRQIVGLPSYVTASKSLGQNSEYTGLQAQVVSLQGKKAEALQEYTPDSVEVREIENQITSLQTQMRALSSNLILSGVGEMKNPLAETIKGKYAQNVALIDGNNARVAVINAVVNQMDAKIRQAPTLKKRYAFFRGEVDILKKTYEDLSSRYFSLLVQEQSNMPSGMIASHAMPNSNPSNPYGRNLALVVILASACAAAGAILFEKLDLAIHDPATADRITGLTSLAAIPITDLKKDQPTPLEGDRIRLLIGNVEHDNAFLESFRLLRNNIAFAETDSPVTVLGVTSAGASEGKSTVSVNLAIALGMDGKRVLVIDGDLRQPTIHKWFKSGRETGLTTVVQGRASLADTVRASEYDGVSFLPSGPLPPNPTEVLNSMSCRRVFMEARHSYDFVIVDCPPASGLSDVQVITTMVDASLLVVTLQKTNKNALAAATRLLTQAGAKMLGTVVNRIDMRFGKYSYASYYYSYNYNYSEEDRTNGEKTKRKKKG